MPEERNYYSDIGTTDGGGSYYINGMDGKAEVIEKSDNTQATYNIQGFDKVGQVKRTNTTWTRYYYLKDHLGTVKVTVDATGNVTSWDDNYPYGMVMEGRSGNIAQGDTRYKYTGKERDIESQYDYFGARYYDARIGRWLAMDPLAEKYPAISGYSYALANPVGVFDPNGKWPEWTHNRLINSAFSGDQELARALNQQNTSDLVSALKGYSRSADVEEFQSPEMSYRHAMRDASLSPEEGIKEIDKFLNTEYSRSVSQDFGFKLHAIMDMTAPSHEGVQPWGNAMMMNTRAGFFEASSPSLGSVGLHALRELLITRARFNATVKLMQRFRNDYLAKKRIDFRRYQEAFDQDLADEEAEAERQYQKEQEWREQMYH